MSGALHYRGSVMRLRILAARCGYALGAVLILAAVVVIGLKYEEVADALVKLRNPSPSMIALLLAGVFVNVILTGLFFGVLMARYGNVRMTEMTAVLAVATLMNYLPMQPGLIARLAYHKRFNQIRLRDSVKVQIQAMSISTITSGGVILIVLACRRLETGIIAPLAVVTVLCAAAALWPPIRHYMAAVVIRLLELVTWAARYYAAFRLLHLQIDVSGATALACVSMAVSLLPMFSNGLGIREWTIGPMAPLLTTNHYAQGLAAELLNRAGEVVIVSITGLIALVWLAHHRREFVFRNFRRSERLEQMEAEELQETDRAQP